MSVANALIACFLTSYCRDQSLLQFLMMTQATKHFSQVEARKIFYGLGHHYQCDQQHSYTDHGPSFNFTSFLSQPFSGLGRQLGCFWLQL